jgi:hypothetical protein
MKSRFLNSFSFSKEEVESLKKIRIIKPNLIHVQSIPKSLTNVETLKTKRYFGQYGTIKDIALSIKINDNNKETYSVYITYENEIEAACAILCVDSLLIFRKVLRVFFGTTKYCVYFLENKKCPNPKQCMYLHELVTDKKLIIDSNNNFSFNEHWNMSKKIIEQSKTYIKDILSKPKKWKSRLPYLDFIFLSEEEKQLYCSQNNICYVRNFNDNYISFLINNKCNIINIYNINNIQIGINNNNIIKNNKFNQSEYLISKNDNNLENFKDFDNMNNVNKYQDPFELYNIFKDSINHILLSKPFFDIIKNAPLKKLEYNYFKNDLSKKGVDINILLKGCLDCIKDCM